MSTSFQLNGEQVTVDVDPDMPLLWVVREPIGLTGTKFGCGIAACGACTMHVDGVATRTCVLPVSAVEGATVRTIEGIAHDAELPCFRMEAFGYIAACDEFGV